MYTPDLILALLLCVGGAQGDPPPVKSLAGWPGLYPKIDFYQRTFAQPRVDKEVWSQTARYVWTGGRKETVEITLARNPDFASQYSETAFKKLAMPPEKVKVGAYEGWLWPAERLVLILAKDCVAEVSSPTSKFHKSDLVRFAAKVSLEEAAKALEKPPRRQFDRKVETFAALRKGMSLDDVTAWVGPADKDVGSGIHIMAYGLADGSQVLIGFPDFNRLIYVKHRDKDGTATDLVK